MCPLWQPMTEYPPLSSHSLGPPLPIFTAIPSHSSLKSDSLLQDGREWARAEIAYVSSGDAGATSGRMQV